MTDGASASPRRTAIRAARPWRVALEVGVLVAMALLTAACGSGSAAPGVASLGSTTTTAPVTAAAGSKAANYADAVAYSQCMRAHGVSNFPDPDSNGAFVSDKGVLNGRRISIGSSQYVSADKACAHLLPDGGKMTPAEQQQALAKALKFVQCMRTHGVPNMPDPKASGGGIEIGGRGFDPGSPQFQTAQKACRTTSPFP